MIASEPQPQIGQSGFWSYVRQDDEDERQRLSELSRLLSARVRVLTGDPFTIFLDRTSIGWGADWEARIDEALLSTTFFIPLITPSYFRSDHCREELVRFTSAASSLGLDELVLPIYYIDVPELNVPEPTDELMRIVKRYNWEMFQDEGLEGVESSVHRKGVDRLARRLIEASALANAKSTASIGREGATPSVPGGESTGESNATSDSEEDDGPLDVLANGEAAIHHLDKLLTQQIGPLTVEMGTEAEEATRSIHQADTQGKGFAGRLRVSREYAVKLDAIADRLEPLARDYLEDLLRIDNMVQMIARMIADGDQSEADFAEFFTNLREMAEIAETALESTVGLAESVRGNATWSKDLKKPSRRIETALLQIADGRLITRKWLVEIPSIGSVAQ